ncbi:MAG: geranylgeranylglyceryl/heptaprenylglyceryl phosphate synthase [Vicingaceae bacterium]
MNSIYTQILSNTKKNKKQLAVLIDPDKQNTKELDGLIEKANKYKLDFWLVGGSLLVSGDLDETVKYLKNKSEIPVILFPGSPNQISKYADGILFLSLISGRNPEMLIGNHVIAAPYIKKTNLEVLSTGYLIIDAGKQTTASYISNSTPIPQNKPEIAACTALAGQYLGLKNIYLDAGSGAQQPVSNEIIKEVKKVIDIPLIVGGGIKNKNQIENAYKAGADIVVIGNALEKNDSLLADFINIRNNFS